MNGAMAELCAKIVSPPKMNNQEHRRQPPLIVPKERKELANDARTTGQILKKPHSSSLRVLLQRRLFYHVIPQNKNIHPASIERIESFLGLFTIGSPLHPRASSVLTSGLNLRGTDASIQIGFRHSCITRLQNTA